MYVYVRVHVHEIERDVSYPHNGLPCIHGNKSKRRRPHSHNIDQCLLARTGSLHTRRCQLKTIFFVIKT